MTYITIKTNQKEHDARIAYKNATLNVNFCQHLGKILMYLYIVIHQKDSATMNRLIFPPQIV
jgi:hypothetical protein